MRSSSESCELILTMVKQIKLTQENPVQRGLAGVG